MLQNLKRRFEKPGQTDQRYLRHIIVLFLSISVCVLILVSVFMTVSYNRFIVNLVESNNRKVLTLSRKIEDTIFSEVYNNLTQLSMNADIKKPMLWAKVEDYDTLGKVKDAIVQMSSACSFIDSVYVAYPKINKIVTDYGYLFEFDSFADQSWLETANTSTKKIIWIGEHEITKTRFDASIPVLSVVLKLPYEAYCSQPKGYIVINMDTEYVKNYISQNIDEYSRVIIWDENEHIVCATQDNLTQQMLEDYRSIDFAKPAQHVTVDDHRVSVLLEDSGVVPGWRYAAYSNELHQWEELRSAHINSVVVILAVLLLAAFLVYRGSLAVYRPIASLASATLNSSEADATEITAHFERYSDLSVIYQNYTQLARENVKMKNTLQSNMDSLQERFYVSLLLGYVKPTANTLEYAKFLHINVDENLRYAVGLIQFPVQQSSEEEMELETFLKILISNEAIRLAETMGYSCYVLELASGELAAVLSLPKAEAESRVLFDFFSKLHTFADESLHAVVSVCVSEFANDLFCTANAFRQANTILKYAGDYDRQAVLLYQNFRERIDISDGVNLTAYQESIVQSIKAGNPELIRQSLTELRQDMERRMIGFERARYMLINLNNIVSVILQLPYESKEFSSRTEAGAHNVSALIELSIEHFSSYAEQRAMQNQDKMHELAQKMLNFIREHHQEDISLNTMSEAFLYTPSYINRILKLHTKHTFYELLTDIRIEKAKEDLLATRNSVAYISESVGYTNVQSFIRMFKKLTGVTPGQFRSAQTGVEQDDTEE